MISIRMVLMRMDNGIMVLLWILLGKIQDSKAFPIVVSGIPLS